MPEPDVDPPTRPAPVEVPAADSLIGQAPRMMRGGLVGSHVALLVAVVVAWVAGGTDAAETTVLAGLTVSLLMIAGQYLQMILVQRADAAGMAATLAGFGVRVVALGAGLALWLSFADTHPMIRPWGVVAGCCTVSLGWLAGVLVTYSRLRIPIFDQPSEPTDARHDTASGDAGSRHPREAGGASTNVLHMSPRGDHPGSP